MCLQEKHGTIEGVQGSYPSPGSYGLVFLTSGLLSTAPLGFALVLRSKACTEGILILTWKSSMNYLAAVNRVTDLILTGKLNERLRNENYCKENFGVRGAQVIMDAIDGSKK